MENKNLNVELRTETGKNENRRLRDSGFVPAVLYSHGETEVIKVPEKDFLKLFKGQISESVIFDVKITNKKGDSDYMAFVKDYDVDSVTGKLLHIDLFRVTKGEKINTNIPLEIVGNAVGVKMGGILEVETREIEIECLPKDLPEKIQIDVSELDIGDSIHAEDIKLENSVVLMSYPETVIASVQAPRKIEEEELEEIEGEEIAEGEGFEPSEEGDSEEESE